MAARARTGPDKVAWTSHDRNCVSIIFKVDGMFVDGLEKVDGGRCGGILSEPEAESAGEGRVAAAGAGVGGWVVGRR